jgi:hypothetical protein
MNPELSIHELTQRFAAELAQRSRDQLERLEADCVGFQADLATERQRSAELEARLAAAQDLLHAQEQDLAQERAARQHAQAEVAAIHAAIASQLEQAEQEQAGLRAAEAERERQHQEHLEALRLQLTQERLRREALQQRVEALRSAAADLFSIDLASPVSAVDPALAAAPSWGGVAP